MGRGGLTVPPFAVLAALAMLLVAGCTAFGSPATSPTGSPTVGEDYGNLTVPEPPETLTAETAARTATQFHLARIAREFGENGTISDRSLPPRSALNTDVMNRTSDEDGYYARVTLRPGSLPERNQALERTMYLLTEGAEPRVAAPVADRPVESYRGSGEPAGPVDLRVTNFDTHTANATVVLTRVDGTPETAYLGTLAVENGTGVVLQDAIASAGTYRVTAATEDRSVSRSVVVRADGSGAPIGVFFGPDGGLTIQRGPG